MREIHNPETKDLLYKYITRNPDVRPEDAHSYGEMWEISFARRVGGFVQVGSYHGGGSPIMEAIAITTQYDIETRKKMVKRLAGIPDQSKKS